MKITFKQLSLFVAIAQRQNLSQGATACFLSQPAASMALAELEQQLAHPLFDRVGKKLVLNANGLKLYPQAVELLDRMHHLESLFQHTTALNGQLKIGASSTIGNYLLPPIIARFMQLYPQVKIVQTIGNSQHILEGLEKFTLDIGLIESHCSAHVLASQRWQTDHLVIFAADHHPLAQQARVSLEDLQQAAWILREPGSGTRQALERVFTPNHIVAEIGSTQAIKKMVADSLALSCASRFSLQQELQQHSLTELPVTDLALARDFLHVWHPAKYSTPIIQAFNALLF